jgi:hypothetical protein
MASIENRIEALKEVIVKAYELAGSPVLTPDILDEMHVQLRLGAQYAEQAAFKIRQREHERERK